MIIDLHANKTRFHPMLTPHYYDFTPLFFSIVTICLVLGVSIKNTERITGVTHCNESYLPHDPLLFLRFPVVTHCNESYLPQIFCSVSDFHRITVLSVIRYAEIVVTHCQKPLYPITTPLFLGSVIRVRTLPINQPKLLITIPPVRGVVIVIWSWYEGTRLRP